MDKPSRSRSPGRTIPQLAVALNWPEKTVRNAVARGDIRTIDFAGRKRIPPAEEARLRELFPTPDPDEEISAA
jgi:hypothetical protein